MTEKDFDTALVLGKALEVRARLLVMGADTTQIIRYQVLYKTREQGTAKMIHHQVAQKTIY